MNMPNCGMTWGQSERSAEGWGQSAELRKAMGGGIPPPAVRERGGMEAQ